MRDAPIAATLRRAAFGFGLFAAWCLHGGAALAGNTSARTGKGAVQDNSVYCQNVDGREARGPYSGTRRQIPCGPNFRPGQAAAPPPPAVAPPPTRIACAGARGDGGNPRSGARANRIVDARALAAAVFAQYNGTPIRISRLTNTDLPECSYLVLLAGTEFKFGQSNNLFTDLLSSPGLLNEYFVAIENALYSAIPSGASLILAGHSLGGMEAQNIAANARVRGIYNILEVITFGSPKTVEDAPGVRYVRFMTAMDPVPALAVFGFVSPPYYILLRTPPGTLDGISAHLAYPRSPDIGGYDALGNRGGRRALYWDTSEQFAAPGFLFP